MQHASPVRQTLQPVLTTLSRVESLNRNFNAYPAVSANSASKTLVRDLSVGALKRQREMLGLSRSSIPKLLSADSNYKISTSLTMNLPKKAAINVDHVQISLAPTSYGPTNLNVLSPKNKSVSPLKKPKQTSISITRTAAPNVKILSNPNSTEFSPDKRQVNSKSQMKKMQPNESPSKTQAQGNYMQSTVSQLMHKSAKL